MTLARLSLTDFVDVVSASGSTKANKVTRIKTRPEYRPAFDFYKPLRDRIIEAHSRGFPRTYIGQLMPSIKDKKKIANYPNAIQGYTKWWGRKKMEWFDPPRLLFTKHDIDVSVNPELGLVINGDSYLIKLYFKADPLTKNRIDVIHYLMNKRLQSKCPTDTQMAILDVRKSRLLVPTIPKPNLAAMLDAELAYIATLWINLT